MYHDKYKDKSTFSKLRFWICIILVYTTQIFCLTILAYAYLNEYYSSSKYSISKAWVVSQSPLHFFCVMASIIVLFSYLTSSIAQSVKLFCSCLNLSLSETKNRTNIMLFYGIIMSTLNLLLISSTWIISLVVINYSLYNKTEKPYEVILNSVANVFILEIDDYFCSFFKMTFAFDPKEWKIKVNNPGFQKSSFIHNQFSVYGLLIWAVIWALASGEFYADFSSEHDSLGAIRTLLIIMMAFIIALGTVSLTAAWGKGNKRYNTRAWMFGCIMNFAFSCHFSSQSIFYWNCWNECLSYLIIQQVLLVICIILFIMMVIIHWRELFGKYEKVNVDENSVGKSNNYASMIFILYEILSLIQLCQWRLRSAGDNEGCYVIGVVYFTFYVRYYGESVFVNNVK